MMGVSRFRWSGRHESRLNSRFLEFLTANMRNPHTRRAYARSVGEFLTWCDHVGIPSITAVEPLDVTTYIEMLGKPQRSNPKRHDPLTAPSVKQHLAAIRHLFDWLVVG
jgi:site-specific recombinase XerD